MSDLRLGVHDASRIEWAISVPLPRPPAGEREYEVEYTVEVPANLYSVHNVWDHKQTFTRLTSPSEEGPISVDRRDMDELRRDTLGVAHRIKMLRKSFELACKGKPELDTLEGHVTQAVEVVAEMRRNLDRPSSEVSQPGIVPEVRAEWALADEFLSHQLLEFLGGVQRQVDLVEDAPERFDGLRCLITEALAEELVHRKARGFVNPNRGSQKELGRYVERGSALKKHFHGVLYLDVEAWMTDYKLRNWTGIIAACIAAAFWLGFTLLPIAPGMRAGIGIGTFAAMFAVTYALKDRIKELTRLWLTGRLTALYGQRMVRLRLPPRIDASRKVLVEARETFDCTPSTTADALNREVGTPRKIMVLTFRMKVELHASQLLSAKGIHSVKHVFRYDMTPIFSRLDDAIRPVPVLDESARRVCFVEAPKQYRLPVRVVAREKGQQVQRVDGELVLSKRGIDRIELGTESTNQLSTR
jgi:hypothetical protein